MDFLSKLGKDKVASLEQRMPWLHEDVDRQSRWKHMFDPTMYEEKAKTDARFRDAMEKVDLNKDPVLNHFNVSHSERSARRLVTEHVMDILANEAVAASNSKGILHETTSTASVAAFTTWALPLVRKIWPRLFLWNVTSVQPMSQATGRMFTLDFLYGTSGGTYTSGTSIYKNEDSSYSDDLGEGVEPRELNLSVTSTSIAAISKKLKGLWNIEAQQDLQSYHGLNLENEIVKMMGMQIEREINRYCIDQMVSNASTNTNWASSQPTAASNAWSNATPRQYAESLWDSIEDANREIKNDIFVDANFILCGTTFASRLRKLNGFKLASSNDALQTDVLQGPNMFGTLNQRYVVYEDPFFMPRDKAVLGHKGSSWLYTGSAYCPYVPVWRTPVIHNTKMQPGVGYLTRFAFQVVNGDFYATVTVT